MNYFKKVFGCRKSQNENTSNNACTHIGDSNGESTSTNYANRKSPLSIIQDNNQEPLKHQQKPQQQGQQTFKQQDQQPKAQQQQEQPDLKPQQRNGQQEQQQEKPQQEHQKPKSQQTEHELLNPQRELQTSKLLQQQQDPNFQQKRPQTKPQQQQEEKNQQHQHHEEKHKQEKEQNSQQLQLEDNHQEQLQHQQIKQEQQEQKTQLHTEQERLQPKHEQQQHEKSQEQEIPPLEQEENNEQQQWQKPPEEQPQLQQQENLQQRQGQYESPQKQELKPQKQEQKPQKQLQTKPQHQQQENNNQQHEHEHEKFIQQQQEKPPVQHKQEQQKPQQQKQLQENTEQKQQQSKTQQEKHNHEITQQQQQKPQQNINLYQNQKHSLERPPRPSAPEPSTSSQLIEGLPTDYQQLAALPTRRLSVADLPAVGKTVAELPFPSPQTSPSMSPTTLSATSRSLAISGPSAVHSRPYLRIIEQPKKAIRYLLECKGYLDNVLPESKTSTTIEIVGYKGPALITLSLVTATLPYKCHPYSLVGRDDTVNGVCTVKPNIEDMRVVINDLSIKYVHKKDIETALTLRESMFIDPFECTIDTDDFFDSKAVRLCFEAYLKKDETDEIFKKKLPPVVTNIIYNGDFSEEFQNKIKINNECLKRTDFAHQIFPYHFVSLQNYKTSDYKHVECSNVDDTDIKSTASPKSTTGEDGSPISRGWSDFDETDFYDTQI